MSWRKHLVAVPQGAKLQAAINRLTKDLDNNAVTAVGSKFSSYLPEIYAGQPNRLERYQQYDCMDRDPEVNAAIDTIADFSTLTEEHNPTPFQITYRGTPTETETDILKTALQKWCILNSFKQRMWRIFRSTLVYGDQFFIRDPETFKWYWANHEKIESIIVNEAKGKEPSVYNMRDIDLNLQSMAATLPSRNPARGLTGWAGGGLAGTAKSPGPVTPPSPPITGGSPSSMQSTIGVDAEHVIHLSLSEGLDANWPFGNSLLEAVFKPFKQKELLEDAIIIYRVQRAPERRVFYIDVGNAPTHKAMEFVNRIKNEIHQRRIPSQTGGGANIMDAGYNPLSMLEDFFFPQTAEGRGSRVETLPGGDNLGEIDDLKYFNNKLLRGLRVPPSYLPFGPDDTTSVSYTDGRVGTAYMQEFRFAKFCRRLQTLLSPVFDQEFKLFLRHRGIQIDPGLFELEFNEPENFSKYRQLEIDAAQINTFQPLAEVKFFSKRFLMKRFLNMTPDEIAENERLWREENPNRSKSLGSSNVGSAGGGEAPGLNAVGIRPESEGAGDEGFGDELNMDTEGSEGTESPISGAEAAPDEGTEL
jgi:hypothetical protein